MPLAGQRVFASDFQGSQVWTPAVSQPTSLGLTVIEGAYSVINGDYVIGNMRINITGTGTLSTLVAISLPANPAYSQSVVIGYGYLVDASSGIVYQFHAYRSAASTAILMRTANESTNPYLGTSGFTAALASGDQITMSIQYRIA